MVRLIDDLLDSTRIARGLILLRRERCDLTTIVSETAGDYCSIFEDSGMELEVEVPPEALWIEGDRTRLGRPSVTFFTTRTNSAIREARQSYGWKAPIRAEPPCYP